MKNSMKYFFPRIKARLDDAEYSIKRRWQRAIRGYGDADIWNMDGFLSEFLYKMMDRFIKSKRNGYPSGFGGEMGEDYSEEKEKRGIQEWEGILVKIRDGFQAANDMCCDNCPAEYPYEGKKEVDYLLNPELEPEEHKRQVREWLDKHEIWYKERMATFEEGMDLFKKHFFSLWN
jgi:hypothetical protein